MMTLMECARKVCYLMGTDSNEINEIYFIHRKIIRKENTIKGLVMRTDKTVMIVPDLNNMEYILQYDIEETTEEIIHDLVEVHQFSQRDVARIFRYSNAAVSRIINKNNKGEKENESRSINIDDQGGIK